MKTGELLSCVLGGMFGWVIMALGAALIRWWRR